MTDIIKTIDPWFLNMSVIGLAVYFLWSMKALFKDLKDSINELKALIKDLYDHRNDHESRIVALETKCTVQHGGDYEPIRVGAGRRAVDNA